VFIGEYTASVDDKGRVAIPAKFRAGLNGSCVVTKGLDNSLSIYPIAEFQKIAEEVAVLPMTQAANRGYARFVLSGAMDLEIDKQGRITLPENLRQFGKVKKQVIVTGLMKHMEIWDVETWNAYRTQIENESNAIAETMTGSKL
jgi:MraZ protein